MEDPFTFEEQRAAGPAPELPGSHGVEVPAHWQSFRHPYGVTFRCPGDWTLREAPGIGYQLIPPDAVPDSELYLLGAVPAGGVPAATDPRVTAAAESLMAQLAPGLRRVGPVEPLTGAAAPAVALVWLAPPAAPGIPEARGRMFVVILKDLALCLAGIGARERVKAREAVLRGVLSGLSVEAEERDPAVAGAWRRLGTTDLAARDSAGRLQASSVSDSQETLLSEPTGLASLAR